jgi:hypothetical protein
MFDTWQTSTEAGQTTHFDKSTASIKHYLTLRSYIPISEVRVGAVVIVEFAPENRSCELCEHCVVCGSTGRLNYINDCGLAANVV